MIDEDRFTSLELSKKLAENGCISKNKYVWYKVKNKWEIGRMKMDIVYYIKTNPHLGLKAFYTYDLYWDICKKYGKEFFGDNKYIVICQNISYLLMKNPKQEAEEHIWDNCLFNPRNKEK